MKTFNANKLPNLTKIMYESQQRLNKKNWEDTLKADHKETEKMLVMVSIFDTWRTSLERVYGDVARDLIKETFMDAYMSIHFACMALYKQAHVSLRAELETALRLVYFSTHPVEFKWWRDDKDYFHGRHVWGDKFDYFRNLEYFQRFEQRSIKLFEIENRNNPYNIGKLYKILSKYVHSGFPAFLTTMQSVAPTYKRADFNAWAANFKEVQKCVNTILALGFPAEFKALGVVAQRKVLRVIGNRNYKQGLKQAFGLRIRGRI